MYRFFRHRLVRFLPLVALAGAGFGFMACHKHGRHAACHACEKSESMAAKAAKRFSKRLDLNESQKGEVETLFRATFEDACKLREGHGQLRKALVSDLQTAGGDHRDLANSLNAASQRIDSLKTVLLERYTRLLAVLTPEQRRELAKLIESHT